MKKPDYSAATMVITLMGIVAWLGILASVVLLLLGLGIMGRSAIGAAALPISISLLIVSILTLAGAQVTRAVIDNARISWEMLQIMRGENTGAEPSPRSRLEAIARATGDGNQKNGAQDTGSQSSFTPVSVEVTGRRGKLQGLTTSDGGVVFETMSGPKVFSSIDEAREYFS